MIGTRTVSVIFVMILCAGSAVVAPVAGDVQPDMPTASITSDSPETDRISISDVEDQTFNSAWRTFIAANSSINNISSRLSAAADSTGEYEKQAALIRNLSENVTKMDRATANATAALTKSDLTPAQQSILLAQIAAKRSNAKQTASDAVSQYQAAVTDRRTAPQSDVTLYFGGALAGGLVLGAILGAVVPFREAKNVEEQLKLSRNVSYNRRAGLVPVLGGLLLVVIGIGLLVFLNIGDLIGVFV